MVFIPKVLALVLITLFFVCTLIVTLLNDNRPIVRYCCDINGICPDGKDLKPFEANLAWNFDNFNVVKERPCQELYDVDEDDATILAILKVNSQVM